MAGRLEGKVAAITEDPERGTEHVAARDLGDRIQRIRVAGDVGEQQVRVHVGQPVQRAALTDRGERIA